MNHIKTHCPTTKQNKTTIMFRSATKESLSSFIDELFYDALEKYVRHTMNIYHSKIEIHRKRNDIISISKSLKNDYFFTINDTIHGVISVYPQDNCEEWDLMHFGNIKTSRYGIHHQYSYYLYIKHK